jgi:hypothetical protein
MKKKAQKIEQEEDIEEEDKKNFFNFGDGIPSEEELKQKVEENVYYFILFFLKNFKKIF